MTFEYFVPTVMSYWWLFIIAAALNNVWCQTIINFNSTWIPISSFLRSTCNIRCSNFVFGSQETNLFRPQLLCLLHSASLGSVLRVKAPQFLSNSVQSSDLSTANFCLYVNIGESVCALQKIGIRSHEPCCVKPVFALKVQFSKES